MPTQPSVLQTYTCRSKYFNHFQAGLTADPDTSQELNRSNSIASHIWTDHAAKMLNILCTLQAQVMEWEKDGITVYTTNILSWLQLCIFIF